MTDTRIAELERRVAQLTEQYAAAQKEIEAMSYAVSHDLRAPLRSLQGFSQALLEALDTRDAQSRHYLERIQQASRKMSELLDALLALSRVARAEMHPRPIDMTQLCMDAGDALRARYPNRHMDIQVAPGLRAVGDQRLVRTLIDALLDNAAKFSAAQQRSAIDIGQTGEGAFYVADNGVGFDMAYVEKLFKPFQRLHPDSEFPGIGIGLAMVHRIAARHGGRAWIENLPPKGTRVFFTLG